MNFNLSTQIRKLTKFETKLRKNPKEKHETEVDGDY
jgi:hypothetical protein